MKHLFGLLLVVPAVAGRYFKLSIFAPMQPDIDGKKIEARDRMFAIGADLPTTYCGLENLAQCPNGTETVVNEDMTSLGSAVPGGQYIFVAPDGTISYPSAHSSLRPPGSQMGGFYSAQVASDCSAILTVLGWQSEEGEDGLWACPAAPGVPLSILAILKATTSIFHGNETGFVGQAGGCVMIEGLRVDDAGEEFAAWAYS